jgi:hypothetical protein
MLPRKRPIASYTAFFIRFNSGIAKVWKRPALCVILGLQKAYAEYSALSTLWRGMVIKPAEEIIKNGIHVKIFFQFSNTLNIFVVFYDSNFSRIPP